MADCELAHGLPFEGGPFSVAQNPVTVFAHSPVFEYFAWPNPSASLRTTCGAY
jgi:hypothetical protein